MQKDFHLYGTYYAARIAGFVEEDAKTIAWAAQHVDKNTKETNIIIKLPRNRTYQFNTILTQIALEDTLARFTDTHRQVFCAFHFPPGNFHKYGSNKRISHVVRRFRGLTSEQVLGSDEQDRRTKITLLLITRPNSDTIVDMVNDTKEQFGNFAADDRKMGLFLLGFRMHTFADSWAHQDHVGTPDKEFSHQHNFGWYPHGGTWEVEDKVIKSSPYEALQYKPTGDIRRTRLSATGGVPNIFGAVRYFGVNSGHGTMKSWPDYPWAIYEWRPEWSDTTVKRNNPEAFFEAFVNMVHAMKCVQGEDGEYEPVIKYNDYRRIIGDQNIQKLKKILDYNLRKNQRPKDMEARGEPWKKKFVDLGEPEDDDKKIKNELKAITPKRDFARRARFDLEEFLNSDFYRFHRAAKIQYRFMMFFLRDNGFRLVWTDRTKQHAMIDDHKILSKELRSNSRSPRSPRSPRQVADHKRAKQKLRILIANCMRLTKKEEVQLGLQMFQTDLLSMPDLKEMRDKLEEIKNLEEGRVTVGDPPVVLVSVYKLFSDRRIKQKILTFREELQRMPSLVSF
jgi:hypothetical protein